MDLRFFPGILAALIPIVAISGWIIVAVARTIAASRVRELQIRERIAMIEKGLVPPPEVDPAGFDRAMARHDRDDRFAWSERHSPGRHRRAGIILMGVGLGMMILISLAGHERPETAVGVGGFLVVLGVAFFISSLFDSNRSRSDIHTPPTNTPPPPAQS
jgi:hypothetical protein